MVTVCPGSSVAAPPFHATGVAMGAGFSRAGATTVGTGAVTAETGAAALADGIGRGARGFDRRAGSARMTSRLETTWSCVDAVWGVVRSRAWGGASTGVARLPGPQPASAPSGSRVQHQNERMDPPNGDDFW
jgi:hypothetical protein